MASQNKKRKAKNSYIMNGAEAQKALNVKEPGIIPKLIVQLIK